MTDVNANEVAGRLIHYADWIEEAPNAAEHAARLYVVILGACDDESAFLPIFKDYWRAWGEKLGAHVERQLDERGAAKRERNEAREQRDAYMAAVESAAVRLWQRGGKGAEETRQTYLQREGSMNELCLQVALDSDASDEEIAARASAEVVRKSEAKGVFEDGDITREDVIAWNEHMMRPEYVSEAHRRLRQGPIGAVLREFDERTRGGDIADRRRFIVETIFGRK